MAGRDHRLKTQSEFKVRLRVRRGPVKSLRDTAAGSMLCPFRRAEFSSQHQHWVTLNHPLLQLQK